MKQFIIRLAAMAAMTAAIVACDKENLDPAPDNGRNESIVELTLKNESAADRTRAFGAGTTEAWEKSISSAVLIVYNASGTQILRRVLTSSEVTASTSTPIKLVLPGVDADTSCDFYVVINRTVADNITTETALLAELDVDDNLPTVVVNFHHRDDSPSEHFGPLVLNPRATHSLSP